MKPILLAVLLLLIGAAAYYHFSKDSGNSSESTPAIQFVQDKPAPLSPELVIQFQLQNIANWENAENMAYSQIRNAESQRIRGEEQIHTEDYVSPLGGPVRSRYYSRQPIERRRGGVSFVDQPSIRSRTGYTRRVERVYHESVPQVTSRSHVRAEGRRSLQQADEATEEAQAVLEWISQMRSYYREKSKSPFIPMREWTGSNGVKRKFSIVELSSASNAIVLFSDGTFADMELRFLSEEDRRYVNSQ